MIKIALVDDDLQHLQLMKSYVDRNIFSFRSENFITV